MKQKMNLKESGSLFNYLMANNKSIPEIGKGATVLHYSDRHAYEVVAVSKDLKRISLKRYQAERIDNFGMSDSQSYKYEKLYDDIYIVVYRYGSWYIEYKTENKKEYSKINILFGKKEEYYDFSF